ncbi:MAG TPA: DUF445 family protein [Pyrodictium sp.]|nr:DUF445 family protein [Pyrodictium sp.]
MIAFPQQILTISMYAIAGAIIGYITNVVAVKLLFHPQKPVRIGPFTVQGLIPARIEDIGKRLANILSKDLTKKVLVEALREALGKGLVRDLVEENIDRKLRETLARVHPAIPALIDTRGFAHQIALIVEQVVVGGNSEQELTHIADQIANRIDLAKHARQALENIDSRELEAMFREIAGKELRFVEISGALLGSLIGVINGILTLLLTA